MDGCDCNHDRNSSIYKKRKKNFKKLKEILENIVQIFGNRCGNGW